MLSGIIKNDVTYVNHRKFLNHQRLNMVSVRTIKYLNNPPGTTPVHTVSDLGLRSKQMLKNGSFTEGWTDMPPVAGYLVNQQPNHWTLHWLEVGESLFGAGDTAQGIPECVHKLARQLPANEQLGAENALILEGDTTYKIFSATAPFGAELSQTVTGLQPGSSAKLIVPVLVVLHGETDPYGAESGVWVNGEGHWVNGGEMGNRNWYRHEVNFTVPSNGTAEITIRVKSKWARPKDFFIDGISLEAVVSDDRVPSDPTPVDPIGNDSTTTEPVVKIHVPSGMLLVVTASPNPDMISLTVPEGTQVEEF